MEGNLLPSNEMNKKYEKKEKLWKKKRF